jgi:deazaflavin-dependent oxidoreductase (nitroreductase family)
MAENHWSASPDRGNKMLNVFPNDEYACLLECVTSGTLKGDVDFATAKIGATGRTYELQCCFVFHFNDLHVTNRLLSPLASRLPGMGVVLHVGRKTHRQYRTPVMVFRRDNRFIIALTYGRDSQWVQNVLAANGCELENKSRKLRLSHPRLFENKQRQEMPPLVRFFLGILNVSDFLELTVAQEAASQ